MDHVIKTRVELRRGEARLNYSSSEILGNKQHKSSSSFIATLLFIYMKDLNKSFKSQNVLGINGIQV